MTAETAHVRTYPVDRPSGEVRADDLIEFAWGVIANASGGNWEKESAEWRGAAARWRDQYHRYLDANGTLGKVFEEMLFGAVLSLPAEAATDAPE
jgi:hypothetical protein